MLEKIALQKNLITRAQCREAVAACKGVSQYEKALKAYFLSRRWISPADMKSLVAAHEALKVIRRNTLFGTTAVGLGLLEQETLDKLIELQKQGTTEHRLPTFIGDLLVRNGTLCPEQVMEIQAAQAVAGGGGHAQEPAASPSETAVHMPRTATHSQVLPGGMILDVTGDGMAAFLRKSDTFEEDLSVADVMAILANHGIVHGVVKPELIQGFLGSAVLGAGAVKVAEGTPPVQGREARVVYFFETDHLKAGGMDENGNMDFKDRGEIPWVEEETLLARKVPMEKATPGRDVHGRILDPRPVRDIPFSSGKGAFLSADDLEIHSEVAGYPELGWDGEIRVNRTYLSMGNVDYHTGHLSFMGDIMVSGTLKSGFRVKGEHVVISAVDGGEIIALGDVEVKNGVNGGRIYCLGSVKAKYLQNATISCLGNVRVSKNILDSTIECSGSLYVQDGEVISSHITAHCGVHVRHLGTEKSAPNQIFFGTDLFIANGLARGRSRILQISGELAQLSEEKVRLGIDLSRLRTQVAQLAFALAQAGRDPVGAVSDGEARAGGQLARNLNRRMDEIRHHVQRLVQVDEHRRALELRLMELNQELARFKEWQRVNTGRPHLRVSGRLSPGTQIQGTNSRKVILEPLYGVTVYQGTQPGADNGQYRIFIDGKT